MSNPDTGLYSEKKAAQRWMTYVLPYFEVENGELSNRAFGEAMKAALSSSSGCTNDPSAWVSDGPMGMDDWSGPSGRIQTSGGWVDGVYNNPTTPNIFLIGTRTSGIMRTTDGGQSWVCVTDGLGFPVLGTRRMVAAPDNSNYIIVATGAEFINGGLIFSADNGLTWNNVEQELPQFYWLDFHPSVNGLMFATSKENIYYSTNYGVNWSVLGAPLSYDPEHKHLDKIIIVNNRIYFNTAYPYDEKSELYRADITWNGGAVSAVFSNDISQTILPSGPTANETKAVRFSNAVGNRFMVQIRVGNQPIYTLGTQNGGNMFLNVGHALSIDLPDKNELIVSVTDPLVYYHGTVAHMRRYKIGVSGSTVIQGTQGSNGHHDDYRSSQILIVNGEERLVLGNDGGVGVVYDALAPQPTITGINGDLSVNLIHAFDIHEKTKRSVYAFQDHYMIYRDRDGSFSNRFLQEGSAALTQQFNHDAIVGEYVTLGIMDKPNSPNKIVAAPGTNSPGSLGNGATYLGGYFTTYRHFPERFARGLASQWTGDDPKVRITYAGVALNRAKLVSEIRYIELCKGDIGPVAICEKNPSVIYAAERSRLGIESGYDHILFKSTDDGITWESISGAPVSGQTSPLRNLLSWRHIRSLAVNHADPDILYCGIGGRYSNGPLEPDAERVFKSIDGGGSFFDYSEGLPFLPIERMLTIDSSNELVFCGTSAGVFYRTSTMTQWECFSNGLPNVQITGMKYDYCDNMLYVSTYGRGMWKTPMNLSTSSGTVIEIAQNTIWDTDRGIFDDVLIKAGYTLTITASVAMGKMKGIRVEPNAQLIVDGGTITSFCNSPWRGIEVHGNTSQHQQPHSGGQYHQGRAIFNRAVIENAWQGVMNWKPDDWGSRGGIIQASNTTFRNNRIDAIFMAYQNFSPFNPAVNTSEQSFFLECDFILDNDYLDDPNQLPPRPRITMWRTDRLRIQGCNFTNTQTVDASEKRSRAIYSHDANYLITEYCPGIVYPCPEQNNIPNRFTGWHKAIEALETASSRPITVRNSVFDENMIGVELGGADYSQIYKNDFNLGGHPFSTFPDAVVADENHLGIFANETYHFSIEENTLTRPAQGAPFDGHGILVFNSKGANNVVYKNNLSNLKTGINGWQVNRNINAEGGAQPYYAGLQYICNQNQQNFVDFEISRTGIESDFGWNNNGIRLGQGSSNPPRAAANTFSGGNPDPLVFTHFTINSYGIYGYFHFGSGGPTTNEIGPGDMGIIPINITNNCPSNYTTGILTGLTGKTQLLQKKAEYEGMLYAYNQLIDNGNTPATVTEVELTWPQQAWQLRDQLMQRAPYNSETVLIAAIDRNIMPHAMLLEVLLANPDALRSGNVIRRAETVPSPPMPQYMIDLLWAARNQSTLRTAMESTMAELFADLERSQKIILTQKAFADSTYSAPDSTLYYLSKVKTVEGNYSRAAALAERHMYTQAIALVDSMQLHYKLSNERLTEMNALKNLYTLMAGAHGAGLTIANLDSARVQGLRQMAENPTAGIAAKKAQNALCFHYQICYNAQGQPKSNASPHKPQATYEELVAKLNTVTAYPNPSDQYVTIAYTLLHAKEQTTLQVFDATGRRIESRTLGKVYEGQQLFDTRKLPGGVYLFQIVQEGKKVSDGKFVVTH